MADFVKAAIQGPGWKKVWDLRTEQIMVFSMFWREEGERTELGKEVEDRKNVSFWQ